MSQKRTNILTNAFGHVERYRQGHLAKVNPVSFSNLKVILYCSFGHIHPGVIPIVHFKFDIYIFIISYICVL